MVNRYSSRKRRISERRPIEQSQVPREHIRTEHEETFRETLAAPVSTQTFADESSSSSWVSSTISAITITIVALLALRFILLLFGATPINDIANTIYALSEPFVAPFYGLFGIIDVATGTGSIIDASTLFAMAVYGLIGWALVRMIDAGSKPIDR